MTEPGPSKLTLRSGKEHPSSRREEDEAGRTSPGVYSRLQNGGGGPKEQRQRPRRKKKKKKWCNQDVGVNRLPKETNATTRAPRGAENIVGKGVGGTKKISQGI